MFLERYRPDMNSSTMFMLETVDNGSNNQTLAYAGGEAVRSGHVAFNARLIVIVLCRIWTSSTLWALLPGFPLPSSRLVVIGPLTAFWDLSLIPQITY